ncbi:MAG: hypothetical protein HKN34_04155 [Gammaproteobacteria bacterium]|nr:hypothetical protein [Gammaproteobacteria bacterium]
MSKILLVVLLLSSSSIFAVQKYTGNPDEVIKVTASITDPNIISISGGSIDSVWGTEDKVMLEANADTGQALFRPMSLTPFTLFVQTLAGNTYTLSITPKEKLIGQSIVIDEFDQFDRASSDRALGIVAYKQIVKRLLRDIDETNGVQKIKGFQLQAVNEVRSLWAETKILHAVTWNSANMMIDKYVITNVSDNLLVIEEREFKNLARTIRAIAIRKHQLKPAESTVMYTIRGQS